VGEGGGRCYIYGCGGRWHVISRLINVVWVFGRYICVYMRVRKVGSLVGGVGEGVDGVGGLVV